MSLSAMVRVWRDSPAKGTDLLVLLAMADVADEEGKAWPSVELLAVRARVNRRTVQRALRNLEQAGEIRHSGEADAGTNVWTIRGGDSLTPPGGGKVSPPGGRQSAAGGAAICHPPADAGKSPSEQPVAPAEGGGNLTPPGDSLPPKVVSEVSVDGRAPGKKKKQMAYPAEFEAAWSARPRRGAAADDPKRDAFHAWNAAQKRGHSVEQLQAGMTGYAAFCRFTGREGSEYVMQTRTLFGPSDRWKAYVGWKPNGGQGGGKQPRARYG